MERNSNVSYQNLGKSFADCKKNWMNFALVKTENTQGTARAAQNLQCSYHR